MTTIFQDEQAFSAQYLDRDEDANFRSWHGLPDPSLPYFIRNSIGMRELLVIPFADCSVVAVLKRLANEGKVDDQLLVNVLACALFSDDPSYTAYNSLVLLEYFTKTRFTHGLSEANFASAVAGLSAHNGVNGNRGMHRLSDPEEIAGVAAVVMFIGTMNRNRLVKPTVLHHEGTSRRKELAISSRYLDRLIRLNPEHLESISEYLMEQKITTSRSSVQPIIEMLEEDGMSVRLDSLLTPA